MINWKPSDTVPRFKPTDPEYGKTYLIVKDCGVGTLPSISVAWLSVDGWRFSDDTNNKLINDYGYRVTHYADIENLPV